MYARFTHPLFALSAWAMVLALSVLYCEVSAPIFDSAPVTLGVSMIWAFETWAGWIALSALALWLVPRSERGRLATLPVPLCFLLAAGSFAGVDGAVRVILQIAGAAPRPDTTLAFLYESAPRWALGAAVFAGGWLLARRRHAVRAPDQPAHVATSMADFTIPTADGAVNVRLEELEAIESAGNYVALSTPGGRSYVLRATLKGMLETAGPRGWIQVHRRALINPARVRRVAGARIELASGRSLVVGRRFRDAIATLSTRHR